MTEALDRHLYKVGETYIHNELLETAARAVCRMCIDNFRAMVLAGPFRHRVKQSVRVLACCAGEGETPSVVVSLNEHGDLLDHLSLPFLLTVGRVDEQGSVFVFFFPPLFRGFGNQSEF